MPQIDTSQPLQTQLLTFDGPGCLVIRATLSPIAGLDRFQPAGFPEIGHVTYKAPRVRKEKDKDGNVVPAKNELGEPVYDQEDVCIVDSAASMANHLETVCMTGQGASELHDELSGLPFVICKTNRARIEKGAVIVESEEPEVVVASTLTEGHRLASDYFIHVTDRPTVIDGKFKGQYFREVLTKGFGVVEVPKKKGSTFFFAPGQWWDIFKTIFAFDPNSLVHGVMFAKEQIKISRVLTAHMEAFGARRVVRSGVKFDRLGKTTSGQPIFSVSEETASEIRATFILDLALLRSFGRGESGLNDAQKRLLLDLSLWKIRQLLARPFRYRTQCHLKCDAVTLSTESQEDFASELPAIAMGDSIKACKFAADPITRVYYPAADLFKAGKDEADEASSSGDEEEGGEDEEQ